MPVIALGTVVTMAGSASAHTARPSINITGTVSISPAKNIVDHEAITVHASGFNSDAPLLYAFQCDPRAVSTQDQDYCDTSPADSATPAPATNGSAKLTFHALTGADFKAPKKGAACGFGVNQNKCVIVVSDSATSTPSTDVGFAYATFKDTRAASKTTLKGKKSAKAKSKVTFKVATTGKGSPKPTGTVVIKDNGKKVAKVKEKNGKATAKFKIKKGKNKLTAAYSGNKVFKPSTAKATIKGK
jgi:hypothetical protein